MVWIGLYHVLLCGHSFNNRPAGVSTGMVEDKQDGLSCNKEVNLSLTEIPVMARHEINFAPICINFVSVLVSYNVMEEQQVPCDGNLD